MGIDSLSRQEISRALHLQEQARLLRQSIDDKLHGVRVGITAMQIAKAMGMDGNEQLLMLLAGFHHDKGKTALPSAINNKPGPLNVQETKTMQQHPQKGVEILRQQEAQLEHLIHQLFALPLLHSLDNLATEKLPTPDLKARWQTFLEIVMSHHEKWDGSGYPQGLKGEEIPFRATVAAFADVWDALLSVRVYRDPDSLVKVVQFMQHQMGQHFNPALRPHIPVLIDTYQRLPYMQKDRNYQAAYLAAV